MSPEEKEQIIKGLKEIMDIMGPKRPTERMILGNFDPDNPLEVIQTLTVIARDIRFGVQQDEKLISLLRRQKRKLIEDKRNLEKKLKKDWEDDDEE